jgi:hypothetical protein
VVTGNRMAFTVALGGAMKKFRGDRPYFYSPQKVRCAEPATRKSAGEVKGWRACPGRTLARPCMGPTSPPKIKFQITHKLSPLVAIKRTGPSARQ